MPASFARFCILKRNTLGLGSKSQSIESIGEIFEFKKIMVGGCNHEIKIIIPLGV